MSRSLVILLLALVYFIHNGDLRAMAVIFVMVVLGVRYVSTGDAR